MRGYYGHQQLQLMNPYSYDGYYPWIVGQAPSPTAPTVPPPMPPMGPPMVAPPMPTGPVPSIPPPGPPPSDARGTDWKRTAAKTVTVMSGIGLIGLAFLELTSEPKKESHLQSLKKGVISGVLVVVGSNILFKVGRIEGREA